MRCEVIITVLMGSAEVSWCGSRDRVGSTGVRGSRETRLSAVQQMGLFTSIAALAEIRFSRVS